MTHISYVYEMLLIFQHFVMFFLSGTDSYREHSWSEVVDRMEKALKFYLEAEEECRFACEKPFDMGWFPDFIISISSKHLNNLSLRYLTYYVAEEVAADRVSHYVNSYISALPNRSSFQITSPFAYAAREPARPACPTSMGSTLRTWCHSFIIISRLPITKV